MAYWKALISKRRLGSAFTTRHSGEGADKEVGVRSEIEAESRCIGASSTLPPGTHLRLSKDFGGEALGIELPQPGGQTVT